MNTNTDNSLKNNEIKLLESTPRVMINPDQLDRAVSWIVLLDELYATARETGKPSPTVDRATQQAQVKTLAELLTQLIHRQVKKDTNNHQHVPVMARSSFEYGNISVIIDYVVSPGIEHTISPGTTPLASTYSRYHLTADVTISDAFSKWTAEIFRIPTPVVAPNKNIVKTDITTYDQSDLARMKFLHARWADVNEPDPKKRLRPKGGYTIAVYDNMDGTLVYAISRCSDNDLFCKKTGRDVAMSRLGNGYTVKCSFNDFRKTISQIITTWTAVKPSRRPKKK